jgi:hypothetical protein
LNKKNLKLESLADNGDGLYNIASDAANEQICEAYVLFIRTKLFLFIFPFLLMPRTLKQWLAYH